MKVKRDTTKWDFVLTINVNTRCKHVKRKLKILIQNEKIHKQSTGFDPLRPFS